MAAELTVGLVAGSDSVGLIRSAACVFNQSWTGSLAVSVVADTTSEQMMRAIDRLQARYGRIVVFPDVTGNSARRRNEVLRNTDTGYLAWIDAGDLWHPRKLELQFRRLVDTPSCSFVSTSFPDCLDDGITALLGDIRSWHRAGELDEQLVFLADEELLLRLVVSDVPNLIGGSCGQRHGSANHSIDPPWQTLAAEIDSVWKRHKKELQRQCGRDAAVRYRRRQLLSVAEAAQRGGDGLQAARYRSIAAMRGLMGTDRHTARTDASGWARRSLQTTVRRGLELGARAATACQLDPGSRWVGGVVRVLQSAASGPPSVPALENAEAAASAPDRRVMAVAAAAVAAGKPERAVSVLESRIKEGEADPAVFVRLGDVYLAGDGVDRAVRTLELGVKCHPRDGRLHRLLAEAFARRLDWKSAIDHWNRVPAGAKATARVWTIIGVVRAYRQSGDPKTAFEIGTQWTSSRQANEQLLEEIHLCRPSLVDWSRCLCGMDEVQSSDSVAVGVVESAGFLHGGAEPLVGRITSSTLPAPVVSFCVNGHVLATTVAADSPEIPAEKIFSVNCADVLKFLGDGDIVQIKCGDGLVPVAGYGDAVMVYCGLPSRFPDLKTLLRQGFVFTKDGRLRPGHNEVTKSAVLDFFFEVANLIELRTGQQVFPFYGNLLGAIREGDFIAHDVDGFDAMYLCGSSSPEGVKRELGTVCRILMECGYYLDVKPSSVMIRKMPGDARFVDLSYGWFNGEDDLNVSYGWRSQPAHGRARFVGSREVRMAGRTVPVPGNAEEVLEQLYGPNWRVPDQGFTARRRLIRDEGYLLDGEILTRVR